MIKLPSLNFSPIGIVNSPYKEKFAIPRQPGLVNVAKGSITLIGEANNIELTRGLEQYSHLWLLFIFHGTQDHRWSPLVRPPRLGGNKKLGVLATRSTFRPNPIGMSVVKLDSINEIKLANNKKEVIINISGLDLLDATPIIDIKPYIPYCDSIDSAMAGFAQEEPTKISVSFSENAKNELAKFENIYPDLYQLIVQVLSQDPRPAYKQGTTDEKNYGMNLYDLNIQWKMASQYQVCVQSIHSNKN